MGLIFARGLFLQRRQKREKWENYTHVKISTFTVYCTLNVSGKDKQADKHTNDPNIRFRHTFQANVIKYPWQLTYV